MNWAQATSLRQRGVHTRLRQLADFPSLILRSSFAHPSLNLRSSFAEPSLLLADGLG
ncbi:hypothetical protein [Capnocytophaga bilenii]